MTITRVQGNAVASSGTTTSQAGTLSTGVTLGNLLVASVTSGATSNAVTPPSGWTQVAFNQPNSPANCESGLWYLVVDAGHAGGTSWTFTFGSAHNAYIIIEEWNSSVGWAASPVDQTSVGNTAGTATTSTTPTTGTTATTANASELWIATLTYDGGVQTESSLTSGWTKDLETHDTSNNHTATMLYQVASATGTASCSYTIGTAEHWAGAVATFKTAVTTNSRTVPTSAVLLTTNSRTLPDTAVLLVTNSRNVQSTAVLLTTNSRNISSTADIALTHNRAIPASAVLDQPVSRTISTSAVLLATNSRVIISSAVLLATNSRVIASTNAVLLTTNSRNVPSTVPLVRTNSRQIVSTAVLLTTNSRNISSTADLTRTSIRTIPTSAVLFATNHRTIPASADLTIEIAIGGFGLYGNGTGTVGYDMVRFTQYPDPALNLSPVLPRLGNSLVSWTDTIPTNTTLAVKTSLDGVNFTDVTSQNGGMIPGLMVQPAPIIDLFNINTLANYTNTSLSGGSVATVTYDTINSRMTLSGGSGGLYLYSAISDNDIDMFANMDESDAGGLVWRYVDGNNYYELGVYDDSSSSGFTSQLRLYKVVAGSRSLIGSASSVLWPRSTAGSSPYKIIRVTMLGTAITIYFDGTIVQTATDSTFASGKMGLRNDGGTSRYYQLRLQQIGDYVSGNPAGDIVTADFVYTQVSMSTTDPSVTPQLSNLSTSASSPQIAQGALIPQLHDPTKPFAEFFNTEMDTLCTTSGDFYWNVAQTGSLSFLARTAVPAPFCLHSSDLLFTPNVKPTHSADLYRNRQNITNCLDTITVPNEQKIADGTATSWTMAYPLFSAPTITVQGTAKTVGVQGIDIGKDFYWQSASNSIGQDASATAITSGFLIEFTYVGEFTRTVTVDNLPEQAARQLVEGGTGIVEAVEDGKGMLASSATIYAQGLLAKHGNNNTVEIIVSTQRPGLAQGMILPVFIPEHQLNNRQLLIVKLTTTGQQQLDGSVLYEYQVDATDGPNLSNFANVFFG